MQPLYLSIGSRLQTILGIGITSIYIYIYTFERAIKLFQLGGPSSPLPPIRLEKLIYSVNPGTRAENKRRWQKQLAYASWNWVTTTPRYSRETRNKMVGTSARIELPSNLIDRPQKREEDTDWQRDAAVIEADLEGGWPEHGLIALYQWNPEAWPTGWGRNLEERVHSCHVA